MKFKAELFRPPHISPYNRVVCTQGLNRLLAQPPKTHSLGPPPCLPQRPLRLELVVHHVISKLPPTPPDVLAAAYTVSCLALYYPNYDTPHPPDVLAADFCTLLQHGTRSFVVVYVHHNNVFCTLTRIPEVVQSFFLVPSSLFLCSTHLSLFLCSFRTRVLFFSLPCSVSLPHVLHVPAFFPILFADSLCRHFVRYSARLFTRWCSTLPWRYRVAGFASRW